MLRREFMRVLFDDEGEGGTGGDEPASGTLLDLAKEGEGGKEDDDTTPGIDLGDDETGRPSYVPEKFWDKDSKAPRTEVIMKSYAELERDFKRNQQGLPEGVPKEVTGYFTEAIVKDGKVIMPEGLKNSFDVKADDAGLTALAQVCMDNGIPVAAWEKLVPAYYAAQDEAMGPPISIEEEMNRLGPNKKDMLLTNGNYLDSLVAQGVVPADKLEMLKSVFFSYAEGVQALDYLRLGAGHAPIPIGDTRPMAKHTEAELQEMMGDKRYNVDKAFTDEVDKGYEDLYGTEPAGSSVPTEDGIAMAIKKDKEVLEKDYHIER